MAVFVSVPLEAGLSIHLPSSQCQGKTPAEFESFYGISGVNLGLSIGFLEKHLTLQLPLGYSQRKRYRKCICPVKSEKSCVGPPSPHQNPPDDEDPTPTPPPKKKNRPPPSGKPEQSPCGKGPACAGNRTGPDCSQPDMWPNTDCSGNGKPVITDNCGAQCRCFGGWEGEFCDRLVANGGGDPHLETLDGVNFDFFGIGEFWGCKSVKNDFGLQFRFYYYERASLIGGIALKAGRSIVTITTIKTERVQDLPITRIDGVEINATSNSSEPVEISNGTVLLDRQRRFSFEAEENSVVLISLQYDAGVTVTIDVRHSRVMKRQYLNILYSPTAAYKGHTEGLCGFMDNNATNDYIGPDGTLYDNAVKFAESWRITDCHDGSGTRDSWSWNSSNFYHDDIMDITYTDPSYIPMYSLDGISQSVLQIATSMCNSLNISDNDLQSCIFDVAITNDTTFTDQETFKRDCPDQCSGKGRCVNGSCKCIEGWKGKNCDKGSCLNCSTIHGKCAKGFCVCDLGWEGRSCELEATCFGVNNCTSPEHGSCKTTDVCQCNPGYIGANCSIVPTCNDVSNCTGNGICVDFDVCKCKMGWTGSNCAQYSCEQLDYCSERGSCVAFDKCDCDYGWTGVSCALPDCEAVNQCSNKGECISSDKCRCLPGFVGADCGQVADCSHLANCSGQGVCISTGLLNVSCSCYLGFTGDNCSQPTCTTVNNCSSHGACVEAEFCKCDLGYIGTDCSNFSCEAVNYCSGNGKCVGYDLCLCNSSWSGRACSVPDCSAVKNCSGQGDCILPNICSCYPAFDGEYCDQKAKPNINPPRFDQKFYSAAIVENSPVGTVILQVKANDTDSGRNGQIFYTILSDDNIESILTVGGQSGKVYSAQTLDFETNELKSFNVTMVAADNGYPQKSGIATVQITLLDENDNCPTFIEPPGDLKLEFLALTPEETVTKVSAVDLDSGVNSDITYSLSKNDAFSIHPKTGVVMVVSDLTKKVYKLTVSASDNGDVPCTTDTSLTVKIGVFPTTKPLTRFTNPLTNRKSEAPSDHNTSPLSETTTFTRATTTNVPTVSGAVPQEGPNYAVIGGSAVGGVLLLLIAAR
ncbi:mucin-like protein [Stylophora pistillata]|uniref:mucin-like protein n=1 Tax=Stylophora pistillata TaxID=50429 RepID=UPI000C042E20|nr:mucin-like protein [Stylophora pistillata]